MKYREAEESDIQAIVRTNQGQPKNQGQPFFGVQQKPIKHGFRPKASVKRRSGIDVAGRLSRDDSRGC